MDEVADGRPGNLAVDPKLELDQIALGGAGEGSVEPAQIVGRDGKTLVPKHLVHQLLNLLKGHVRNQFLGNRI